MLHKNVDAIECLNILKFEIESIIDKFVPLNKQGTFSRKKHLSKVAIRKIAYKQKEAIRKISYKQTMWRVYMRTRKDLQRGIKCSYE